MRHFACAIRLDPSDWSLVLFFFYVPAMKPSIGAWGRARGSSTTSSCGAPARQYLCEHVDQFWVSLQIIARWKSRSHGVSNRRTEVRTVQTTPDGLAGLVYQNAGIVVEFDNAAIRALNLLRRPHNNSVPDVTTFDLVRSADRDTATTGLRAEGALLLDDDDDAVTCRVTEGCQTVDGIEATMAQA